jgi:hypothetical protein
MEVVKVEPLHVSLELTPGARPVAGVLSIPGAPELEFSGWTELFAALEAALVAGGPEAANSPATGA